MAGASSTMADPAPRTVSRGGARCESGRRLHPMARLRIALAQLNLVVGDVDGNVDRIIGAVKAAEADSCDLVALPELAVTGYPPEDLLLKPAFVVDNRDALDRVAAATGRCAAVVGYVE